MSRIDRIVLKEIPCYVTQRGNGRQQVSLRTAILSAHQELLRDHVERNPVRAGLVAEAEDYAWSSAKERQLGRAGFVDLSPWQERYEWPSWREALRTSVNEEAFGRRLQEASRRGSTFRGGAVC